MCEIYGFNGGFYNVCTVFFSLLHFPHCAPFKYFYLSHKDIWHDWCLPRVTDINNTVLCRNTITILNKSNGFYVSHQKLMCGLPIRWIMKTSRSRGSRARVDCCGEHIDLELDFVRCIIFRSFSPGRLYQWINTL